MSTQVEPVIFLDIDGVLITHRSMRRHSLKETTTDVDPNCVAELNRLTAFMQADIVLSSSWRVKGIEEMRKLLGQWGVAGKLIDCTPILDNKHPSGVWLSASRTDEIKAWLANNSYHGLYIAIDDEKLWLANRYTIKTAYEYGLTKVLVDRAIELLERERRVG